MASTTMMATGDDPLVRCLLQEREIIWTTNSHRTEEERQQLWARRAGQLNSILGVNNGAGPPSRKRLPADVPRTMSFGPPAKKIATVRAYILVVSFPYPWFNSFIE